MKIADTVWFSLYMRHNKKVQHPSRTLASAWQLLNFQQLKVLESIIRRTKSIITLKRSTCQILTAAKQNLTSAVVKYKNVDKVWPLESTNQTNYMKIADSVWLSLCMRPNEKVQHPSRPQLAPAWAVLTFQHLKVLESMIPKDQKTIITTLKYSTGQPFIVATPAVMKYKNLNINVIPRKH
jgi:hypothetical protein